MAFIGLDKLREMDTDQLRSVFYSELTVSRNRLEHAAFWQAKIFEKWYTLCEEYAASVRDWEDRLGRTEARAQLRIRSMPAQVLYRKYKLEDLKEGAIKSLVQLDPEVKNVKKQIRTAKRFHMMLKGFVESCRHRKSMIRDLEQLYVAKYWDKAE